MTDAREVSPAARGVRRGLLVLLALVLLGGVIHLLLPGLGGVGTDAAGGHPRTDAREAVGDQEQPGSPALRGAGAGKAAPVVEAVARGPKTAEPSAAPVWRGRVVAADSGKPIEGARAVLASGEE